MTCSICSCAIPSTQAYYEIGKGKKYLHVACYEQGRKDRKESAKAS